MGGSSATVEKLGKYTLLKQLAVGGMAELFLARAEGIEGFSKLVVLKRILKHRAADAKFVRMFLGEARLVAGLDHPNIAQVYDIGIERDEYFFAMEFVHGQDLRKLQQRIPERRLRLDHALHVAIGLCAGLHFAHEARGADGTSLGIVHRDVSPHNVLVSYDGAVKLVDFGVAKAATIASETREGTVKGKYGYLSPEQALAEPLDRRSDVFALGILLWEMTIGRRLYRINGELATLQRIVYVDAPRPSTLLPNYPPELDEIVMKALCRDREGRYQTAQELQIDLERFAAHYRLVVSSVAMKQEMQKLFGDEITAWKHAESEGQSLADHVVTQVSDVASESSSASDSGADEGPGLSAVLDSLGAMSAETSTRLGLPRSRPSSPPRKIGLESESVPTRVHEVAPRARTVAAPRRGRIAAVLGALIVVGVVAAVLVGRSGGQVEPHAARPPGDAAASVVVMTSSDAAEVVAAASVPAPDAPVAAAPPADATAAVEPAPDATETTAAGSDEPHRTVKHGTHHGGRHAHEPDPGDTAAVHETAPPVDAEAPPPDAKPADARPPEIKPPAGEGPAAPAHAGSAAPPAGPAPGTMDAAKVRAVVHAHLGEISTCVDRARMDDSNLTGKVTVRIDVSGTGAVTNARVASSTTDDHALGDCIVRAVSSWTFPAPAGGVPAAFSYPFAF